MVVVQEEAIEVEMIDIDTVDAKGIVRKETDQQNAQDIREQIRLIEKGVLCKEPRFILRVLRSFPSTRRKCNVFVLKTLLQQLYPSQERERLLNFFNEILCENLDCRLKPLKTPMPEVDTYLHLLLGIYFSILAVICTLLALIRPRKFSQIKNKYFV